jgi:hypothetical protein
VTGVLVGVMGVARIVASMGRTHLCFPQFGEAAGGWVVLAAALCLRCMQSRLGVQYCIASLAVSYALSSFLHVLAARWACWCVLRCADVCCCWCVFHMQARSMTDSRHPCGQLDL